MLSFCLTQTRTSILIYHIAESSLTRSDIYYYTQYCSLLLYYANIVRDRAHVCLQIFITLICYVRFLSLVVETLRCS